MTASWLRVSLEVDPELAEAVSEVLARSLPGGVVIESTAVTANAEDEGHPIGPLRVMGYIPMDAELDQRRAEIEQNLRYLGLIQKIPDPEYQKIEEQNWNESWKQHYKPLTVGKHLLIVPAWMSPDPADRVPIRIEPGMAFGTGVHPTTQLCLQLLEEHVRVGQSVIDVGCGSAILAIAVAKLGAGRVVAVDIDATALDNARLNATLNEVEIEIGEGSVRELLDGKFSLQKADLVLANILAPVLIRMLSDHLAALLNPGGTLILSGILAEQEAHLRSALAAAGLHVVEERHIQDWLALAARA